MAKSGIFTLAVGLVVGIMLSFMFMQYESLSKKTLSKTLHVSYQARDYSVGGNSFYLQQRSLLNSTKLPVVDNELTRIVTSYPFDPLFNSTLLKTRAKTLCYVMCAKGSQGAVQAARATVAEHCSKTVFFSRSPIKEVGSIDLGFQEDSAHRWERYKMAADYVYTHFRSDFELFIKFEYDIYIVPENIQFMALLHQAHIPGYIGQVITDKDPRGVVTVLTREGLEILHNALPSCPPRLGGTNEDLELEECLKPLHIFGTKESRDHLGTPRFQMLVPDHELPGNTIKYHPWAMKYIHHPLEKVSLYHSYFYL
ncbi:Glycoprotein-N-acetylgalactosamine 3-beta-galactosyltransferase 1 [Holothuria leucospilota]|uniref:Glycoprotein-N-acetylgalactosamine 3-beta-galactosyltransferase 1 n=1 Tax=Holothuria leucospilota TaxID=206669 RepID=A0A9Q0YLT3_HOLLE|nr:Glycoprotein-N-acetylgalactosamine 3-beta-galactosyltransferase 1 [Holothuria leucospilota]